MEIELLQRLRQAKQDLLQRLRVKQEEIRRRLRSKPSLDSRRAPESSVPLPTGRVCVVSVLKVLGSKWTLSERQQLCLCSDALKGADGHRGAESLSLQKTNPADAVEPAADPAVLVPVEAGAYTARAALCSSLKHSSSDRGVQQQEQQMQEAVGLDSSFPGQEKNVVPVTAVITCGKETSEVERGGHAEGSPEKESFPLGHGENSKQSTLLDGFHQKKQRLLDTSPAGAEKSDQYFAELREFRQVNREECVHEQRPEPSALNCIDPEQESGLITSSHKCVYCYRLNQRLFPVPVDSESACPVCKIPRTHCPPEKLGEPLYVRVSIARSTLTPAYKHKAHCRRSFEPEDSLALPSHCLTGWKNSISCSNPLLSSLDLRASLEEKPPLHPRLNLVSRVSGGTRTDQLLNLTHLAHFRLSSASQ
ncbi:uncharacterized protein AAGF69_013399 [Amazona ochrocephala]